MRLVNVDELKGDEILAVPVLSESEVILIQSDVVLEKEYIDKLIGFNITTVYIKDETDAEYSQNIKKDSQEEDDFNEERLDKIEEITVRTKEIMTKVLERHIYKQSGDLRQVGIEAEKILDSVLSEPEVINTLMEIRHISTDISTHCTNVCALATIMALRLRMSEKQVHNIAMGAILHDIGLKYIQVSYFDTDVSEMSAKDAGEYKKHTIYGYSSLQDEHWLTDAAKEIILLHHERGDGSGFPFQQYNEKLRAEIRLVALCDEFDSLISGIGAKKMKIYEAIEYIKVHAGDIYDAAMANKFLESVALYPVGMNVITNEGEAGVVVRQNSEVTDRPVIKMLKHADGSDYTEDLEKDLMKLLTLFIVDTQ